MKFPRIDTRLLHKDESIFFARELEFVKRKIYEKVYMTLKAQQLIPVSTEVPPWVDVITYQQWDQHGIAKIIANYADDLPKVKVSAQTFSSNVRGMGDAYDYTIQDIRQSIALNKNLPSRLASAARWEVEFLLDNIAWFGDEIFGIKGLLTNENITKSAAPDGAGTVTTWVEGTTPKTPTEILADMNNLVTSITTVTKGAMEPDTLLLPLTSFNHIATTARSTTSDTTILQFFKNNTPYITAVEPVPLFDNMPIDLVGGADSNRIMVAYSRNEDALTFEIPLFFTQHPVQERNLTFVINCEARTGGVIVYQPLSVAVLEGI